jgi:hypothetical protein
MIICQPPVQHPYSPVKVAFLTGLSNPKSCALSALQKQFMARLELPQTYKVHSNFPYHPCQGEENEPLWKASIANTRQFLQLRRAYYRQHLRGHLDSFAASCDKLILLTGSSGLSLLNVALTDTANKKMAHVFAFGPVAWQLPKVSCTLIQGSQDYLSRWFFKNVDYRIDGLNHLDYLCHPEVFSVINQSIKHYV